MNQPDQSFPWPKIMQFGLGVLGLAPRDFWAMSLPELGAAMRAHSVPVAPEMSRAELEHLMQTHPDTRGGET